MDKKIKPYHLLIVESNPNDYATLKQFIKLSRLQIEKISHASSIDAVSDLAKENNFDIILFDLTQFGSRGIDSVITFDRLFPKTPIVVFSNNSDLEVAIESISVGAQDYLVKGEFDEKLLAKSIEYSIERKRILTKLKESKERFQLAARATHDVIWDWDIITDELYIDQNNANIWGYPSGQSTLNWFLEKVHPEDKDQVHTSLQLHFEKRIRNWQGEYRFRRGDGFWRNVFDRGYILFDKQGKPYRMIGAMTDITERKKLEEELKEQQLKQQHLITEITIQTQEKEKNELGKELHDNINQILATAQIYLSMVKSGQNVHQDLVNLSFNFVKKAIHEIRKLSHSLIVPSLEEISLKEALQSLVEDTELMNCTQIQLSIDENFNEKNIDKSKKLTVYRIVQEQLTNIIKHAKAKRAVIALSTEGCDLFLSIADNGVGFDTNQKKKGIGLKNIRSRVEFHSGNINIISTPGQGCTLEVSIPVKQQALKMQS